MLKSFLKENINNVVFIRNSYRRSIAIAVFLLLINYALTVYLYYHLIHRADSPSFATTTDGRIINIYPE